MTEVTLINGRVLHTHEPDECSSDDSCSIHNPSNHPLRDAPMNWRADRGLLERICEHNVGHPDPDGLDHLKRVWGSAYESQCFDVHGCCGYGCCRRAS